MKITTTNHPVARADLVLMQIQDWLEELVPVLPDEEPALTNLIVELGHIRLRINNRMATQKGDSRSP